MEKRWLYIVLTLALVLTVTGCSAIQDKIGEKVGEGIVGAVTKGNVKVDGDSVTIKGKDGDVTMEGSGTELPKEFPKEFPVPDKLAIESASTIAGDGSNIFYVNGISPLAPTELYEWYKDELSADWEITSDVSMAAKGGQTYIMGLKMGETEGTLSIMETGKGTEVGIMLMAK